MLKAIEGQFASIGEGIRAYWGEDPYLSEQIPADRVVLFGFSNAPIAPPYAIYRQSAASSNRRLGDHFFYDRVSATLRIYATDNAWLIAKQSRLLFSNMGHIESLEGHVCGMDVVPGAVLRLPNGTNVIEHILRMSIIEYRGPERLRMTNGTIV